MQNDKRKIILAVTGASGSLYAGRLLESLYGLTPPLKEIAVVMSGTAREVWLHEMGEEIVLRNPAKSYDNDSFFAPVASGSSAYDTMIICPASMGTIGRLAHGTSDNLIARAGDVMLKERRKLIIVPRETPLSLIHLRNMETLTLAGAIICPASPSFYGKPETIADLVDTVVGRIMVLAGFGSPHKGWMEND